MAKRGTIFFIALFLCSVLPATASICLQGPTTEVQGRGPLPYNYRLIDGRVHAGGHPLNPKTEFANSDHQVLAILAYLTGEGVATVIDLENTKHIQPRYERLLRQAGVQRLHIPLHASRLPTEKEWQQIKQAIAEGPVYIHCKWGADRTGAIIGRYLVEEQGYRPEAAYLAVVSGGSHAGHLGGLKTAHYYDNLKRFVIEGKD
jgi:protein tyrosine phosphatase (PTP) superfamily phosphohydrolase (DUF442 family)